MDCNVLCRGFFANPWHNRYKVCPCALATSLDIGLSNLSLKTITLSFYSKCISSWSPIALSSMPNRHSIAMCKSSTLAFVLIFAFLFKLEKPRLKLIAIIVIITAGVLLMVSDETDFVVAGYVHFDKGCNAMSTGLILTSTMSLTQLYWGDGWCCIGRSALVAYRNPPEKRKSRFE